MWEEQIASVVFVKRGKLGIFCEVLFWDGKRVFFVRCCFGMVSERLFARPALLVFVMFLRL